MESTHARTELIGRRPVAPPHAAAAAGGSDRRRCGSQRRRSPIYALIVLYPSLAGAYYAFTDWSGIGSAKWSAWRTSGRCSRDDQSFGSLVNTIMLTAFIVVVQNAIGLALALGVHTVIKSRYVLRVLFFAPAVLSPVVIAFLWKYMFNPQPDAGLNAMLGFVGLGFLQQDWLGDPSVALWSVGLTVVWQFAGYSMVIFLAGLQGIPQRARGGGRASTARAAASASGTSGGRCSRRR